MSAFKVDCPRCGKPGRSLSYCRHCGEFISMALALSPADEIKQIAAEAEAAELASRPSLLRDYPTVVVETVRKLNHKYEVRYVYQSDYDKLLAERDALLTALELMTDSFDHTRLIMDDKTSEVALASVNKVRALIEAVKRA